MASVHSMNASTSPANTRQPVALVWDDEPDSAGAEPALVPQCEDCLWAAKDRENAAAARREPESTVVRYQNQFGPLPRGVFKFYWMWDHLLDDACSIALQIGAPIRNWGTVTHRLDDGAGQAFWGQPVPEAPLPVSMTDVYVRYQRRFAEVPPRRLRIAPPLHQPDEFDLGMEAAITAGRPVEDWQSLIAPVRIFRPPVFCDVHREPLRAGYGRRVLPGCRVGPPIVTVLAKYANSSKWQYEADLDGQYDYPVAYCQSCRDEEAFWCSSGDGDAE